MKRRWKTQRESESFGSTETEHKAKLWSSRVWVLNASPAHTSVEQVKPLRAPWTSSAAEPRKPGVQTESPRLQGVESCQAEAVVRPVVTSSGDKTVSRHTALTSDTTKTEADTQGQGGQDISPGAGAHLLQASTTLCRWGGRSLLSRTRSHH